MADQKVTFDILTRDRSTSTLRGIGNQADRTSDKFRRFGRVAGRTAAVAGVALGGALVVAGRGFYGAAKAAAEEEQEMAVLRNTLRKTTKATESQVKKTEDWVTSVQNATGVADGDLRPALGKLVIANKDVGKAQDQLNVALDIAAARGMSLDTVVKALAKGAQGSTSGLSRLGLATKDASGKALTFDQILKEATRTMGGAAAAAANTTAGRFQILKARFADLKEEIGAKLLPYLNRLGEWFLEKGIPALSRFAGWVRDKLWPALKNFGSGVGEGVLGFFKNFAEQLGYGGDGASTMKESIKGFGNILTEIVLPAVGKFTEKTLPALGTALGNAAALTLTLADSFVTMAAIGHEAFADLVRTSLNSFSAILTGLQKITFGPMGAKVDRAAEDFERFRARTVGNLDATEQKLRDLKAALDAIRSKSITIGVNYRLPSGLPGGAGKFAGKALPLADGGIVKARPGGTLALIGEGGRDEAVVPLPRKGEHRGPLGGGIHIETVNVYGRDAKEAVRSLPQRLEQRAWMAGWAAV